MVATCAFVLAKPLGTAAGFGAVAAAALVDVGANAVVVD